MRKILENPGVLGASAIIGAIGIVTMAANSVWFTQDVGERIRKIQTVVKGVHEEQGKARTRLTGAISRAQDTRKRIQTTVDRRLDKLEEEHRWLSDIRSRANDPPGNRIAALESALGRCMVGNKHLMGEHDGRTEND